MNQLAILVLAGIVLLLAPAFRGKPPPPTSIDPSVIEAFRKIYRLQMLLTVPTVVALFWVFKPPSSGGALHGLLLLATGILVAWVCLHTYRNWRCPKCGAYLGRNPMYDWQCRNCRTALRAPRES